MRRECRERFPRHRYQRKPLGSDPGMHRGTCVTHATPRWWGKTFPAFPVHVQTAIFHIWQEAHAQTDCGLWWEDEQKFGWLKWALLNVLFTHTGYSVWWNEMKRATKLHNKLQSSSKGECYTIWTCVWHYQYKNLKWRPPSWVPGHQQHP